MTVCEVLVEVDDAVVVLLVVDVVLVVVSSDVVEVEALVEGVVKSRIPGTADGTEGKNNFSHPGHIHRGRYSLIWVMSEIRPGGTSPVGKGRPKIAVGENPD